MGQVRAALSLPEGTLLLADGGGEWEALRTLGGRAALREHLLALFELARALDAGFVLDAPIWQARGVPFAADEAEAIDRRAIAFAAELREEAALDRPVVLGATLDPAPGWSGEWRIVGDPAERLLVSQLRRLAESEIEVVGGPAFGAVAPAVGFVEAAGAVGLPAAVTLALATAGRLADGPTLREAVEAIDAATAGTAAWFTVRCADLAGLAGALDGGAWARRVRGLRVDPAALESPPPSALRLAYAELAEAAPWLTLVDLAGGRGLRHAAALARARRDAATIPAWG